MKRCGLFSVLGLLAVVLTGCGGSTGSSSKEAYVSRVNSICARYNGLQRALGQPAGSLQSQAAAAHRSNVLTLGEVAAIRRVPSPPRDERVIASMLTETERAARTADASTRLVFKDVRKANEAATTAMLTLRHVNARFAAYGLTVCAQ